MGRQENIEIQRRYEKILDECNDDTDQTYTRYWAEVGMPPFGDVTPDRVGNASDTDADHSSPDQTKTPPPKKNKETNKD